LGKQVSFGAFLPFYSLAKHNKKNKLFDQLQDIILECENLGYHSIWLDDHLMFKKMPILECWTSLAALSKITKKIRLGTMVTCNSYRNPALLAKMASTIDNISKGRLELGIGAGVQENEHISYGFSFPKPRIRIERLNESVEIIKKMWTENKVNYYGKYYKIKDASCEPKPVQKPHPPIIIGGAGEKLTLKVTAKHANRFDWGFLCSFDNYKHKLNVLAGCCKTVNRPFCDIKKSCWPFGRIFLRDNKKELKNKLSQWKPKDVTLNDFLKRNFLGTPEECLTVLKKYMNLGVKHFMLFFGDLPNLKGLNLFAEKIIEEI
jgi:F420-dependent oxidoreductase-like protein